jgi:AraC-like DNA-binding protein
MTEKLIIKNMVCPRCIQAVKKVLSDLEIETLTVDLGQVDLETPLDPTKKQQLQQKLKEQGFELLDDRQTQLINAIKSVVIKEIHYREEPSLVNFSDLLSESLHYDYPYLSRLFSAVEGRTIEKYIMAQKIEKVKELLIYDELTLSEIAFRMHYSSAAHLSAQFKKVTGMSPTEFRKLQEKLRRPLDKV